MIEIDSSVAEKERLQRELDAVAQQWETLPPATLLARLYAIENRMMVVSRGTAWPGLLSLCLLMQAQAEADTGHTEAAVDTARRAWDAARLARHPERQAHARVIQAEIHAAREPGDRRYAQILYAASVGYGPSPVAAQAAALEAYVIAGQGADGREVAAVLARAEEIQEKLPAETGWPRWTPAHLYAFGGAALVRAGAFGLAAEWLATARQEVAPTSGIGTAVRLYQAHGCMAAGKPDEALGFAQEAVESASARGVPAWLSGGLASLAGQAPPGERQVWEALAAAV